MSFSQSVIHSANDKSLKVSFHREKKSKVSFIRDQVCDEQKKSNPEILTQLWYKESVQFPIYHIQ